MTDVPLSRTKLPNLFLVIIPKRSNPDSERLFQIPQTPVGNDHCSNSNNFAYARRERPTMPTAK
jgi:hypothetical protein